MQRYLYHGYLLFCCQIIETELFHEHKKGRVAISNLQVFGRYSLILYNLSGREKYSIEHLLSYCKHIALHDCPDRVRMAT